MGSAESASLIHRMLRLGARAWAAASGLLVRRTMLCLTVLFACAVVGIFWHLSRLTTGLIEHTALRDASRYSKAIREFRTLYTSEVVETALECGLQVVHDYQDRERAIPLPATLSLMLGNRITESR